MPLSTLLSQKKSAILGRWLTMIYDSYPPETAIFLRKEKNRFDNPAGYRISEGLEGLYGALLQEMERDQVLTYLDEIIRIRALQNFTLIHISEPTRLGMISYAVFCLKKK